ncbi:uncharacterized protein LOC100568810 [Acyrthosiphon pisum]|uniref:C2H2-type domain-containing protein n=1 Tax=Acyrthosiphon pisum TaxID=7029 RepID=A0A8R2NN22_ACYPI|nr:uncharacterized protein LOC100568810 [Acyrthosiphon pisum]|eukprot:XP_003247787.1 PREDICTED: uncharacterized protein LOC100568810 [Acyrthosiphon pisum]
MSNEMQINECGSCTFQSKELGHVRFHMRALMNKKEPENHILNLTVAEALTPRMSAYYFSWIEESANAKQEEGTESAGKGVEELCLNRKKLIKKLNTVFRKKLM